jgi:DNA-binding HxlR family transcriptional regulator
VGERWTLLIVRDMLVGATRFNDIARGLPGLSRTLLATRLRQLERAGVIERDGNAYALTPAGRALDRHLGEVLRLSPIAPAVMGA